MSSIASLCHFNPNHDPRNGQFSKSPRGGSVRASMAKKDRAKHVLTATAIAAALTLGESLAIYIKRDRDTRAITNGEFGIDKDIFIRNALIGAGRRAATTALSVIGALKINDVMNASRTSRRDAHEK